MQYSDLNNKNLNLSDEIEKLLEEKLLLEMSIKNLRTQYEASTIEKSVEGNNSKNIHSNLSDSLQKKKDSNLNQQKIDKIRTISNNLKGLLN